MANAIAPTIERPNLIAPCFLAEEMIRGRRALILGVELRLTRVRRRRKLERRPGRRCWRRVAVRRWGVGWRREEVLLGAGSAGRRREVLLLS